MFEISTFNHESSFSPLQKGVLMRLVLSNLDVSDFSDPVAEDFFNFLFKSYDESRVILDKDRLTKESARLIKLGLALENKGRYLERDSKGMIRYSIYFKNYEQKITLVKNYLISLFISGSFSYPHLSEVVNFFNEIKLQKKDFDILLSSLREQCFLQKEVRPIGMAENTFVSLKKLNVDEKKYILRSLIGVIKSDHNTLISEYNLLQRISCNMEFKWDADKECFEDGGQIDLQAFLRILSSMARIDSVLEINEKVFLLEVAVSHCWEYT